MTTLIVTLRDRDARDILRQFAPAIPVKAIGADSMNLIHAARAADVVIVVDDVYRYARAETKERLRETEEVCRSRNITFIRL